MLSDLLKWGSRRAEQLVHGAATPASCVAEPVASKALPKFLGVLSQQPAPLLLDFGPVVGGNVSFFGERLGCKLFIEDLFASIDRHSRAGTMNALAGNLSTRFAHADGSVDGVLCWDCFDFLDAASAKTLARQIVRLVKPGGVVMGMFCTSSVASAGYTKYEVADDSRLRHRPHPGGGGARQALRNGDIIRMFEGLNVTDSFLLKNNFREMLLRRP